MTESPGQSRLIEPEHAARLLSLLDSPTFVPGGPDPDRHAAAATPPGYRVERELGRGGGGRVFRAYREGSDRALALKIIHATSGAGTIGGPLGRAWRELELLESVRLPCVPRIVDYGVHAGRLYLAEEFVDGPNLQAWGEGTPSPSRRSRVEVLAAAARAVQSLHERGVIHRDLKPSNLLLAGEHEVMVIDFGLAMEQDGAALTLTEHGTPLGTPGFMSPEQARGERGAISTRSDVYGLGATAYALLTGTTPHDTNASLHEVIRRVGSDEPRDPTTLRPDLPRPLAAVLTKACERDPARRYESAAALADDLERWLAGRPVEAQPPTLVQRAARWAARHPKGATAAACGAIASAILATAGGLSWWGWSRPASVTEFKGSRGVAILSGLGRIIRAWDTGIPDGIGGHALVDGTDGRRVLAVAFRLAEAGTGSTALRVFDFDAGGKQLWSSDDEARLLAMPMKDGTTQVNRYTANALKAVDVFGDVPGVELIVLHSNGSYSGSCIRVYSLAGEVLSEVWHDGQLADIEWIPDAGSAAEGSTGGESKPDVAKGLAVVCGVNSERTFASMNIQVDGPATHPPVLFALRPPRGRQGWLATPTQPEPSGNRVVTPAWYRYLAPATQASWVSPGAQRLDQEGAGAGAPLRWEARSTPTRPGLRVVEGLFWMVGPSGPAPSASPGDVYGREPGTPPASVWRWTERPE